MNLKSLIGRVGRAFGVEYGPARDFLNWPEDEDWTPNTHAGQRVTAESSLRLTVVWACRRVLAETIGCLPGHIYVRDPRNPATRQKAEDHPSYGLIHDAPNAEMDATQFRQVVVDTLSGHGNGYCYVDRNMLGDVVGLWPLHPCAVEKKRERGGTVVYEVRERDGRERYPAERIWHPMILPELTENGLVGRSPIKACRQAIGMAQGAEEYGARLFANDARSTGLLTFPGPLGKTAAEAREVKRQAVEDWTAAGSGANRHKIRVIDNDGKFQAMSIPPDDAQFLETRKFQVAEICRIFRIPPHLVADLERATFSNIEHQAIEFVVYTIMPWLVTLETSLNRVLFTTPDERRRYYVKYNVDGLLRGDLPSRYAAYAIGRQWGYLSANDVRAKEDENPIANGDIYLEPLNMVPAGTPVSERKGASPAEKLTAAIGEFAGEIAELTNAERGTRGAE